MADTNTTNLNLTKPQVGASDDTWGTKINSDLDTIDALFTTGPALLVSKGGTSATTAADARTNLAVPGTGVSNTFTANQIISVTDNTNAALRITQLGTGNALVVEDSTNPDSSPFVVDASGNVGVGTASPSVKLISVAATGNYPWRTVSGASQIDYGEFTGSAYLWNNGSNFYTGTSSNHFFALGTNNTERMRIDSSGNVLVNGGSGGKLSTTSSTSTAAFYVSQTGGGVSPIYSYVGYASSTATPGLRVVKYDNNSTTSQVFVQFAINQDGANNGQINANGASAAAFGTYSDERLKENIANIPGQLSSIMALRPVEFDYKDGSGHQIGFIAQEMQNVYPDAVSEGNDGMLMITAWSKTEARLVKALQEAVDKIDTLEARIAALEAA